jgi:hypothetical protein
MSYPDTPRDPEDGETPIDWREVTDGGFIFLPRREDADEPQIEPEPRIDPPSVWDAVGGFAVVAGVLFLAAAVLGGVFRVFRFTVGF